MFFFFFETKKSDFKSIFQDTVLHSLSVSGSLEGLALIQPHDLLKELASSVNGFGQTPLHLACRHASLAFVAALLHESLGVDVGALDKDGVSPIY